MTERNLTMTVLLALLMAGSATAQQETLPLRRVKQPNLPTLSAGEAAFTVDTHRLYVGDGTANWLIGSNASDLVTGTVTRPIVDYGGQVFNVKAYGASGSGTTTTTSGMTSGGAASLTVARGSSFLSGQGIAIASAGVSGADYIGTVLAVNGNALTIRPGTGASVPSGTLVQHDDTAAIKAALAATFGGTYDPVKHTGASQGPIYFPAGTYNISSPISIASSEGVILRGAGQLATRLVSTTDMASILDLNGFNSAHIEDLAIVAGSAVTDCIALYWVPAFSAMTTSRVVLDRVYIGYVGSGSFVTGIQTGTTNNDNCAGITLRDVTVGGNWASGNTTTFQNGIQLGVAGYGGNNNNIDIEAVTCARLAIGISIPAATQIKIGMYSGTLNNTDIVCPNAVSYVSISGARSEGAQSFFNSASTHAQAIPGHLRISDLFFHAGTMRASGPVITITNAGSAVLENLHFAGARAYIPSVKSVAQAPVGITVIGFVQSGDFTLEQTFDFTTNRRYVNAVILNFSTTNAAMHTSSVIPLSIIGDAALSGALSVASSNGASLKMSGLPIFANNAAAISGGVRPGGLYHTGADPDPVCIVH